PHPLEISYRVPGPILGGRSVHGRRLRRIHDDRRSCPQPLVRVVQEEPHLVGPWRGRQRERNRRRREPHRRRRLRPVQEKPVQIGAVRRPHGIQRQPVLGGTRPVRHFHAHRRSGRHPDRHTAAVHHHGRWRRCPCLTLV